MSVLSSGANYPVRYISPVAPPFPSQFCPVAPPMPYNFYPAAPPTLSKLPGPNSCSPGSDVLQHQSLNVRQLHLPAVHLQRQLVLQVLTLALQHVLGAVAEVDQLRGRREGDVVGRAPGCGVIGRRFDSRSVDYVLARVKTVGSTTGTCGETEAVVMNWTRVQWLVVR